MTLILDPTLFQLILAVTGLTIWLLVYWRGRSLLTRNRDILVWLSAMAIAVLVISDFIIFTAGWEVAGVDVPTVLRGLRSGFVIIVGLAFLALLAPRIPGQRD